MMVNDGGIVINVNPELMNHSLLTRGYSPNSDHEWYLNGNLVINLVKQCHKHPLFGNGKLVNIAPTKMVIVQGDGADALF